MQLLTVLKAVKALKENFRQEYVVDFVKGRGTDDIVSHKHDTLEEFGAGENDNPKVWGPVIRQALIAGYLKKDVESYGVLKLTASGNRYISNPKDFMVVLDREFRPEDEDDTSKSYICALDDTLYAMLKELRKNVARKNGVPTYVVFQDVSLEQMATMYPVNEQELQNIQGVSYGKAKRYGAPFCALIKKYCEENEIERFEEMRVKTVAKKSQAKVKIIENIDRKIPLYDIAAAEGLEYEELLTKIEEIVYSGIKLNIDYFIEEEMDEDHVLDIYDYFMESDTDDVEAAENELGGDYSETEIRLVRIKFISEMAN